MKSTKREWVSNLSQWVSYWQGSPMIGLGSDKNRHNAIPSFSDSSGCKFLSQSFKWIPLTRDRGKASKAKGVKDRWRIYGAVSHLLHFKCFHPTVQHYHYHHCNKTFWEQLLILFPRYFSVICFTLFLQSFHCIRYQNHDIQHSYSLPQTHTLPRGLVCAGCLEVRAGCLQVSSRVASRSHVRVTSRSQGKNFETKIFIFRCFFGPSDQNELYHTPLLSKIWGLGDRIFTRPILPDGLSLDLESVCVCVCVCVRHHFEYDHYICS